MQLAFFVSIVQPKDESDCMSTQSMTICHCYLLRVVISANSQLGYPYAFNGTSFNIKSRVLHILQVVHQRTMMNLPLFGRCKREQEGSLYKMSKEG